MNISSWLVDTINVASITGAVDNYGARTYAATREVKARVESEDKLVQSADGNELQARWKFATDTAIAWTDKIWLPSENPSTANHHVILELKSAKTKAGTYAIYEVRL